jgi:hypothetical protein
MAGPGDRNVAETVVIPRLMMYRESIFLSVARKRRRDPKLR